MTLLREDREKRFSGDDGIPINKGVFTPTHDFQVAPKRIMRLSPQCAPPGCSVLYFPSLKPQQYGLLKLINREVNEGIFQNPFSSFFLYEYGFYLLIHCVHNLSQSLRSTYFLNKTQGSTSAYPRHYAFLCRAIPVLSFRLGICFLLHLNPILLALHI